MNSTPPSPEPMLTERKNKCRGHETDTIIVQHWMGAEILKTQPSFFKT